MHLCWLKSPDVPVVPHSRCVMKLMWQGVACLTSKHKPCCASCTSQRCKSRTLQPVYYNTVDGPARCRHALPTLLSKAATGSHLHIYIEVTAGHATRQEGTGAAETQKPDSIGTAGSATLSEQAGAAQASATPAPGGARARRRESAQVHHVVLERRVEVHVPAQLVQWLPGHSGRVRVEAALRALLHQLQPARRGQPEQAAALAGVARRHHDRDRLVHLRLRARQANGRSRPLHGPGSAMGC